MTQSVERDNSQYLAYTTDIVSAYLAANSMGADDVSALIERVYKTLTTLANGGTTQTPERPQPAVSIKKSVTPDYLVCLEDGKKLKMLKRHLKSAYGMTPEDYRERWGLPADYPMVAPNYAEKRSSLAKDIGLGKTRTKKRK